MYNNPKNSFLFQVKFGQSLTFMAVVTKGIDYGLYDDHVEKYKLKYSNTSSNWSTVQHGTTNVSQCMSISKLNIIKKYTNNVI